MEPGGDWIVCGGSQKPMVYHLATGSHVTTLDTPPGVVTQAITFVKDKVHNNIATVNNIYSVVYINRF